MAAVAGTPSVTVPMGDVKGLPVGVVFMGPAWSEPRLLGFAYSFEQATKARKAPRFVASIGSDPAPARAATAVDNGAIANIAPMGVAAATTTAAGAAPRGTQSAATTAPQTSPAAATASTAATKTLPPASPVRPRPRPTTLSGASTDQPR